jgi:beta-galactosidase
VREKTFSVVSQSLETALLPMDLPIDDTTTLLFSNYEIACLQHKEDGTTIVLMYGLGQLQLWVEYKRTRKVYASQPLENGISHRRIGNCVFVFGKPEKVAYLELAGMPSPIRQKCNQACITDVLAGSLTAPPHIDQPKELQELEKNDLFRGVGCYQFSMEKKQNVVVTSLSDFVTIFKDGKFMKFLYGNGGTYRFTLLGGVYDFICEIWGHSNFDDVRVPSLRYGSLKGMGRTFVVKNEIDLTENWNFFSETASKTSFLMNIDGYNRPLSPLSGVYTKRISLPTDDDSFLLHFSQAECYIRVFLGGREIATVCKIDPYVDITDYIATKEITLTLSVTRRYFSDNVGKVTLLCGSRIKNCLFGDCTYRGEPPRQWKRTRLPLPLPVGENTIIKPLLKDQGEHDLEISFEGSDAILTIFCNEHTIGRIILDNHILPVIAGGPAKNIFVCKEWLVAGGITIKCQALTKNAILNSIRTKEIISL